MKAKRAIAAQMLRNAYLHLSATRKLGTCDRAQEMLMDAERRVKNGFSPVYYDDYGFDCMRWDGKPLYNSDSIEVL